MSYASIRITPIGITYRLHNEEAALVVEIGVDGATSGVIRFGYMFVKVMGPPSNLPTHN
jgi:hypothetical protein